MSTVKVFRAPTDPACATRISVGGSPDIGYYCTYRGNKTQCVEAMRAALDALLNITPETEPRIHPDIRPIEDQTN